MYKKTALELRSDYAKGSFSAEEAISYFLKRCDAHGKTLGALIRTLPERALKQAKALDAKKASGKKLGKLAGVPIILKDNIHIKGEITTCASKFLEHYRAPFDATVTKRIEEEDGIIIAKANMDEFAMGSSNEKSAFFPAKNPWDLERVPGGSSGGSAAACSAGLAPITFGSETGGSVRQPAALCGLYGLKPTYGRVSRFGLVAFGSSLDQISPFARSAKDIALSLEVAAGPCNEDSNSVQEPTEPYLDELETSIQGKKIGVPFSLLEGLDKEIREKMDSALNVYKSLGCEIVEVHLDLIKYSVPLYYVIATAEASTNLARFDGIRYTTRSTKARTLEEVYEYSKAEGYGAEVKQRILLGTFVLSAGYQDAYYRHAQKVRTLLIQDYKKAFKTCDVVILPTAPSAAFKLNAIQSPVEMYKQDLYTISANMTGIPAINIPVGLTKSGLPTGIQIQGPQMCDARVLRYAHAFEKEVNNFAMPPLFDKEVSS